MPDNAAMPPIAELTRIEPYHLSRLEAQGTFTTGLLLERSETATRRQYLADQVDATTNDVHDWRDEALMLNLASFGPDDHQLLIQAGIEGLARHPAPVGRRVPRPHPRRGDRAQSRATGRPHAGRLVGAGEDARRGVAGPRRRLGLRCPRAHPPDPRGGPLDRRCDRTRDRGTDPASVPQSRLGGVRAGTCPGDGVDRVLGAAACVRRPTRSSPTSSSGHPTST